MESTVNGINQMLAKPAKKNNIFDMRRRKRLRALFVTLDLTYADIGAYMDMSGAGAHKMLNGRKLSPEQAVKLKKLPFVIPEELLPPVD